MEWFYGSLLPESRWSPDEFAERVVRCALAHVVESLRVPALSEDEAYEWAEVEAFADRYIAPEQYQSSRQEYRRPISRQDLSLMRAAYQHILAASRIGVDRVGWGIVEESVVILRWADSSSAELFTSFLDLILQRTDQHLATLSRVQYRDLLVASKDASLAREAAFGVPDLFLNTQGSWLISGPPKYVHDVELSLAIMLDAGFGERLHRLLLDSDAEARVRSYRRRLFGQYSDPPTDQGL